MKKEVFSEKFESVIWTVYCTRNRSTGKTQQNVHLFLTKLCQYCEKDPLEITTQDAVQFTNHLYDLVRKGTCKASYVKVILLSLRKFYDFLEEYKYEFRDREIDVPIVNPFATILIDIPDKVILTKEDVPSLSQVDLLLDKTRETNPSLFAAISFAVKMGLTSTEISNLTTSCVGYMKEEVRFEPISGSKMTSLYICLKAIGEHGRTKRYLKVPEDMEEILTNFLENAKTGESEYVVSYKGKHYSERTMQYQLKRLCEILEIEQITFQDLRNLSIFLMKEGGADSKEIAKYTGQEGRWLTRFSGIDAASIFDAADYIRIHIIDR